MKKRYARILAATLSAAMVFTSAPTAAFATELSVSEDVVEAEGTNASEEEVAAEFPAKLEVKYGTTTIIAKAADGSEFSGSAVKTTTPDLSQLKVGESAKVTYTLTVDEEAKSYTTIAGYDAEKHVVVRTFDVVCVKGASTNIVLASLPNTVKLVYGTGNIQLLDSAGKADTNYTVSKVTKGDVATAKVGDSVQVTLASTKSYKDEASKYDMAAFVEDQFDSHDVEYDEKSGSILVKEVDVTVEEAELDAESIVWPTALTKNYAVGDATTGAKLVETASSKYGEFTFTGLNTTTAGEKELVVTFTLTDTNYKFDTAKVDSRKFSNITTTTLTNKANIKVNVAKAVIATDKIKANLATKEFEYGVTYADICPAKSNGVEYSVKDVTASDVIPVGTQNVTIRATVEDAKKDDYCLENGDERMDFTASITIKKPTVEAKMKDDVYAANVGDELEAEVKTTDYVESNGATTYQWYKADGTKIAGATAATYTTTAAGTVYCEVTYKTTDAALKAVLGGDVVVKTPVVNVLSGAAKFDGSAFTTIPSARDLVYGSYSNKSISATLTAVTPGYTYGKYDAYLLSASGEKTALTKVVVSDVITAAIPDTLTAGNYTVVFSVTESKTGAEDIVSSLVGSFTVDKCEITAASITKDGKVVLTDKASYPYGTKASDIKFTPAKEGLGTFVLNTDNVEYLQAGTPNVKLDYVISDELAKNYTVADDLKTEIYQVNIDKAVIKVTANDVKINLGDKLPELSQKAYTVTGLVGKDEFVDTKIKVELAYAPNATSLSTTVGTKAEAIRVKLTGALTGNFATNYTIAGVDGNLVVVDATAPTTPPTVAPTPAPVKQAVAAAPKAAKAKVSVKAGKSYTLKLKYAAGKKSTVKKVTWKSSKKKVATVSSKGKVKAVKAGKATIAATITFKDGSKKKVKFTVTVK